MKTFRKTAISVVALFISTTFLLAQGGTISVTVKQVKNNHGFIMLGLYNTEDGFHHGKDEVQGLKVKAEVVNGEVSCKFTNIPAGTYGIAIYHDENGNEDMDTNGLGIPKEGFGFSNNVYGKFGIPKFEKASFKVENGKTTSLDINVIYLHH